MNDPNFHKMDEAWMNKMKPLRERPISEGMLKGFSASVERRIAGAQEPGVKRVPSLRPVWMPTLAVLVLASAVVLRSPIVPQSYLSQTNPTAELAQAVSDEELQVQEEMEVLQELGVWDEYETLGEESAAGDGDLELTLSNGISYSLA